MTAQLTWLVLAAVTLAGAAGVISTREIMRLVISLGTFLLGVAGFFAFYALPFLAVAEVFVYVGGVLVLFLFAIMAHKPDEEGRRRLGARFLNDLWLPGRNQPLRNFFRCKIKNRY